MRTGSGHSGRGSAEPPLAPGAALRWDVVSRLLPRDAVDVLEIGCGQGAFAARLAARYPRLVAIEPDPTSYAVAAERVPAGGPHEVRNVGTDALGADERFDLVCAFEVLEHLEDDRRALASWISLLRPGGTLMLSTPAHSSRMGAWDELVGHYRRYDPARMEALLHAHGLLDVQVHVFGWPLGPVLETARNAVGRRRLARVGSRGTGSAGTGSAGTGSPDMSSSDMADRTAASGRTLQPDQPLRQLLVQAGTAPFLPLSRRSPGRGVALVTLGRAPLTS